MVINLEILDSVLLNRCSPPMQDFELETPEGSIQEQLT